jgi:hypothetical protein
VLIAQRGLKKNSAETFIRQQWRTQEFYSGGGGGSTNSVGDRENGVMGAGAPESGGLAAAVIWYKKFHFI